MTPSPSPVPHGGSSAWPPEMLNYAIQELRGEYAKIPPVQIVKAVEWAARSVSPEKGRVVLLQGARDRLRIGLSGHGFSQST